MANNLMVTKPAEMQVMAKNIAESNLFGFKTPQQAYAILMLSEASGKHPMALVQDYHIINNRPALKSGAVMSRFQNSGGMVEWIRLDDEAAEATFSHPKGGSLTMKWTIEKAKNAGIYNSNPVWKKYPSNMLRSRLFSDAVSALYPACLDGAITESQAQDIPQEQIAEENKEIEDAEIVVNEINSKESDTKINKRTLYTRLKKANYNDNMAKAFFELYITTDEILDQVVNNDKLFNELLNKYES